MTVTLTYDNTNARVRIDCNGLTGSTALIERSRDQIRWTTVRGGLAATITAGAIATLDDYEFGAGVANTYRVTGSGVPQTATVTPNLDRVWLKSVTRPFLNRAVTTTDPGDPGWSDRASTFDVVNRSTPIAVTELRGSKTFNLQLYTKTADDAQTMDYILASGDVLFVHVPAGMTVPGGHVQVGDVSTRRPRPRAASKVWTLPCRIVAAPGPDVLYAIGTWTTVLNGYASWTALLAANPTWADVLKLIGAPSEVIVP